jgi:hypothetical protein
LLLPKFLYLHICSHESSLPLIIGICGQSVVLTFLDDCFSKHLKGNGSRIDVEKKYVCSPHTPFNSPAIVELGWLAFAKKIFDLNFAIA